MRIMLLAATLVLIASACGNTSSSASPGSSATSPAPRHSPAGAPTGTPASSAAIETNPGGDIPDSQAYVSFTVPSGAFSVKVPEGWARTEQAGATIFTDKLNLIRLETLPKPAAPTVESVGTTELPAIKTATSGFRPGTVNAARPPGGSAILVTYQADSAPSPVTGRVFREAVARYEFWRAGTEAIVTLSSPTAADNVDPWRIVADSFRWS
jgi:hypothetical protein